MRPRRASWLVLGIMGAACAPAAEFSGELGVGAIYSDNIRLAPTDPTGDTIGVATTDFSLHEEARHLVADVAANLQYLTYAHSIYSNELVGDFTGYGKIALLPGRIDWVVQDNFGQQQLDPGLPVTPENLENINYFSTGPDVTIPLGAQLHAQVSVRYSNVSYQLDDLNNNRGDAAVALVHPLSASSNLSFNVNAERVSYDDSAATDLDYTTRQAYVHYDAQGARSKLDVDLGYDDATIQNIRPGGALVRAVASRVISGSSTLELSAGQDISDTGNLLRQLQGVSNVTLGAAAIQRAEDPFTSRYARAAWRFERHRTAFGLALSEYRETHTIETDLNRNRTELDATARRDLSEALVFNVAVAYARDSYFGASIPNDTELRGLADLAWHVGRRIEMHAQYSRIDHSSDAMIDSYRENRFMLTVGVATENRAKLTVSNPVF